MTSRLPEVALITVLFLCARCATVYGAGRGANHHGHIPPVHTYIWVDENMFAKETDGSADGYMTASINMTRMHNPKLPIHIVTSASSLKHTTAVARLLEQGVNIRLYENHMKPGTRAARYQINRDLGNATYPLVRLAQRFCVYADLARAAGHQRVLAHDLDVVFFQNIHQTHVFPGTLHYDVVAPTSRTAQLVLFNSLEGLDGWCNFLVNTWISDNKTWTGHIWMQYGDNTWKAQSDMEALDVYIDHDCEPKGLRCITLTAMVPGDGKHWDVRYNAMFGISWIFNNGDPNQHMNLCNPDVFNSTIVWAKDHRNIPIPLFKPTMTHMPAMHFMGGGCKEHVLMPVYRQHFLNLSDTLPSHHLRKLTGWWRALF